ncbi:MAG: DUF3862 domain-containing protein [bacterium]
MSGNSAGRGFLGGLGMAGGVAFGCCGLIVVGIVIVAVLAAAGSSSSKTTNTTTTNSSGTTVPEKVEAKSGVTLENFNKLKDGMSYKQAVAVLGVEGTILSESNVAGYATKMYTWEGATGWGANMNAMFQNDKLMSKTQIGLK